MTSTRDYMHVPHVLYTGGPIMQGMIVQPPPLSLRGPVLTRRWHGPHNF